MVWGCYVVGVWLGALVPVKGIINASSFTAFKSFYTPFIVGTPW